MNSGSGLVRTSWLKLITGYYISPNLVLSCPVFALLSLACHHVHFPVPIHTQNKWKIYNYFRRNIAKLADGSMHGK
uniref:Uncharacterized protein n=1 Tax=Manihot esculenta TaxID=3983 RepID=A0A2C9TZN3_MANES